MVRVLEAGSAGHPGQDSNLSPVTNTHITYYGQIRNAYSNVTLLKISNFFWTSHTHHCNCNTHCCDTLGIASITAGHHIDQTILTIETILTQSSLILFQYYLKKYFDLIECCSINMVGNYIGFL